MRSLINKVNVNDARFAKLIGDVQQGIADYYTRQMPKILAKVNSLVAREEYEDAMAALAVYSESATNTRRSRSSRCRSTTNCSPAR